MADLTWLRGDTPYYIESACGRYTVCKVSVCGVWQYEAWQRGPGVGRNRKPGTLIRGMLTDSIAARRVCAEHAAAAADA